MYTSFRIQNFRGFRDLELKNLARINLIAGKNNIGKTALLEAMSIYSGNGDPSTLLRINEDTIFQMRRFADDTTQSLMNWKSIFKDFDTTQVIKLVGDLSSSQVQLSLFDYANSNVLQIKDRSDDINDAILDELRIEDYTDFENTSIIEIQLNNTSTYMMINNGRIRTSRNRRPTVIPSSFLYAREKIDARINAKRFSALKQARQTDILVKALIIVEPHLKDLDLLYDGRLPLIYADIGLPQLVSLSSMGDGMNRIASLILAISEASGGVIFIDEIENGLHYSVQSDLWEIIYQTAINFNVQIFATTHSLEMIRAAHSAFKDNTTYDFRYHRLDRDSQSDEIEVISYDQLGMEAIVSYDYEVRG